MSSFPRTVLVGLALASLAACGGRLQRETSGEPGGSDAAAPSSDADASNVGTPSHDANIDSTLGDGASASDATTSADSTLTTANDGSDDTGGDSSPPGVDGGDDGPSCPRGICPTALATGFRFAWFLTVTGTHVYFTFTGADAGGGVASAPLDGGAPVTLVASPDYETAFDIAVDDANVYWVNFEGSLDGLMKVPIGGGDASLLVPGLTYPRYLAVNATDVYWTDAVLEGGSVMSASLSGDAAPVEIASTADPWGIALDSTSVYWASLGSNRGDGTVMKVFLEGGPPVTLASGQQAPGRVVVDVTNVYWLADGPLDGGGSVLQVPLDGGTPAVLASRRGLQAFAIDGTNLYLLSLGQPPATGTIEKAPLDGGPATTLATGLTTAWDIAVDEASVYWTNAGSVWALTPK